MDCISAAPLPVRTNGLSLDGTDAQRTAMKLLTRHDFIGKSHFSNLGIIPQCLRTVCSFLLCRGYRVSRIFDTSVPYPDSEGRPVIDTETCTTSLTAASTASWEALVGSILQASFSSPTHVSPTKPCRELLRAYLDEIGSTDVPERVVSTITGETSGPYPVHVEHATAICAKIIRDRCFYAVNKYMYHVGPTDAIVTWVRHAVSSEAKRMDNPRTGGRVDITLDEAQAAAASADRKHVRQKLGVVRKLLGRLACIEAIAPDDIADRFAWNGTSADEIRSSPLWSLAEKAKPGEKLWVVAVSPHSPTLNTKCVRVLNTAIEAHGVDRVVVLTAHVCSKSTLAGLCCPFQAFQYIMVVKQILWHANQPDVILAGKSMSDPVISDLMLRLRAKKPPHIADDDPVCQALGLPVGSFVRFDRFSGQCLVRRVVRMQPKRPDGARGNLFSKTDKARINSSAANLRDCLQALSFLGSRFRTIEGAVFGTPVRACESSSVDFESDDKVLEFLQSLKEIPSSRTASRASSAASSTGSAAAAASDAASEASHDEDNNASAGDKDEHDTSAPHPDDGADDEDVAHPVSIHSEADAGGESE